MHASSTRCCFGIGTSGMTTLTADLQGLDLAEAASLSQKIATLLTMQEDILQRMETLRQQDKFLEEQSLVERNGRITKPMSDVSLVDFSV